MGLYAKYFLPWFLNREMGSPDFNATRQKVVAGARGTVLEIGFGSGYNLPFYKNIEKLYALEPSQELYEYSKERIGSVSFPVEHVPYAAEDIPLPDASVDSVVSTWTLCSVDDLSKALEEIHRVLKPDGLFFFVEHGRSPKRLNSTVQKILTPVTRHFTGNCHLDREFDIAITRAGFRLETLSKLPEEGRPLMFSYQGTARKSGTQ